MIDFEVDMDEFLKALENMTFTADDLVNVAGAGAAVIKSTQKLLCPIDLGALRGSIIETFEPGDKITEVEIGPKMDYANYVEYGTGEFAEDGGGRKGGWVYKGRHGFRFTLGNRPQPFVRPSAHGKHKLNAVKAVINAFTMLVVSKWKT